jgi:hypothetical protein
MGNFIRNISSWIGAQPDDRTREIDESASAADGLESGTAAPPSMGAPDDARTPRDGKPTALASSALPLVPYAAAAEDVAPRLRRSRSASLLRKSGAVALTSRTVPVLPVMATRHAPAHPTRPVLTETERVRLQVMQAQIQLSALRLYEGPIDGIMSPATATALRYFQTLKGLRPSGTLAAGTLAALGVDLIH